jgi:prepilin-type processing-associated H-X9-DG protein
MLLYDTDAKKLKFLKSRGNIVTFRLLHEQHIINKFEEHNGVVNLLFQDGLSTPPMTIQELFGMIAWSKMEEWHKG